MNDTGFKPPAAQAPAHRADRALRHHGGVAVQHAGRAAAARRRARSDGASHGRRRRACRAVRTARDLSRFARMLLDGGRLDGVRRAVAATVARMTTPSTPAGMPSVRGLGWDIDTTLLVESRRAVSDRLVRTHRLYRHVALDRSGDELYVVFLSSRLHPDGKGDVTPLRGRVATVAAAALRCLLRTAGSPRRAGHAGSAAAGAPAPSTCRRSHPSHGRRAIAAPVLPGIDVLARDGFALLKGKRVGLVTNHTGRSASGATTIDLLHKAPGVQLVALFSPEHGIRGILDAEVPSSRDEKTGLPIHSLYGETRRPTDAMLAGIDTIVIDLQDVGARFYTYMATMGYVMEEAAKRKIAVVVLDRPNPINGWQIEGPAADESVRRVHRVPPAMPVRHGMTLGELARLFNDERKIGATLTVVPTAQLAPRFTGSTRPADVDQPVAEHAEPESGGALSRHRRDRVLERVGRPRHRSAVRAGRRAVDRRTCAGRGAERPQPARAFVSIPWRSRRRRASREGGVPGRLHRDHQSRDACSRCASASRSRRRCGGCTPIATGWRTPNACLVGARDSSASGPAKIPAVVAAGWTSAEARWRLLRAKYLIYQYRCLAESKAVKAV